MSKRRLWIIGCNVVIAGLSSFGIYRDLTLANNLGLIPPPLSQRLFQQLPDGLLILALLVGAIVEIKGYRSAGLINCIAYLGLLAVTIWGTFLLVGDPAFYLILKMEVLPFCLISVVNLWLYRRDWRLIARRSQVV